MRNEKGNGVVTKLRGWATSIPANPAQPATGPQTKPALGHRPRAGLLY